MVLERYWLFAGVCVLVALLILRLVLRERLTLQGSLAYLVMLGGLSLLALAPEVGAWIAVRMGFALASNFVFAAAITGLAILHLLALTAISRLELRTVALVQEVAILRSQVEQLARKTEPNDSVASAAQAPPSS